MVLSFWKLLYRKWVFIPTPEAKLLKKFVSAMAMAMENPLFRSFSAGNHGCCLPLFLCFPQGFYWIFIQKTWSTGQLWWLPRFLWGKSSDTHEINGRKRCQWEISRSQRLLEVSSKVAGLLCSLRCNCWRLLNLERWTSGVSPNGGWTPFFGKWYVGENDEKPTDHPWI